MPLYIFGLISLGGCPRMDSGNPFHCILLTLGGEKHKPHLIAHQREGKVLRFLLFVCFYRRFLTKINCDLEAEAFSGSAGISRFYSHLCCSFKLL